MPLYNLGITYANLENYNKALKYNTQALKMGQRLYEGDNIDIANVLNDLGYIYDYLKEYEKAVEYHLKSLQMKQNLYQGDYKDIVNSLHNLMVVYNHVSYRHKEIAYKKAKEYLENIKVEDKIRMPLVMYKAMKFSSSEINSLSIEQKIIQPLSEIAKESARDNWSSGYFHQNLF